MSTPPESFIGRDPAIEEVLATVRLVADTDATVLITGETGTGKELIARALHSQGTRCRKPFVAVNCGALPNSLLESEIFGHLRGSFTGATESRPGKFEAADGGTIFLDEISEMDPFLQVKLLRVLQTGEYAPVGSAANRQCDVRVVAATNRPLRTLVSEGRFRADLYYRLNVICLDVPPLRRRPGDIPLLVAHFLPRFAQAYGRGCLRLGRDAEKILLSHRYPGNVRELENAIRRAVILSRGPEIRGADLPPEMMESTPKRPAIPAVEAPGSAVGMGDFHAARARVLEEFERGFLENLLSECGGIVSRAAHRSGLSERCLHVKLRKHGLRGRDFRAGAPPSPSGDSKA